MTSDEMLKMVDEVAKKIKNLYDATKQSDRYNITDEALLKIIKLGEAIEELAKKRDEAVRVIKLCYRTYSGDKYEGYTRNDLDKEAYDAVMDHPSSNKCDKEQNNA